MDAPVPELPHQPREFAAEDDAIIQRSMLNRSWRYGVPTCEFGTRRHCGHSWK